jgi:hypothetical protein
VDGTTDFNDYHKSGMLLFINVQVKKERIATGDGNIIAKPKKKERREDDRTQKRMVLKRLLFHDLVICLNCL